MVDTAHCKTTPGILKIIEVIFGRRRNGMAVFNVLVVVYLFGFRNKFKFPWTLIEFIAYVVFTFGYLIASVVQLKDWIDYRIQISRLPIIPSGVLSSDEYICSGRRIWNVKHNRLRILNILFTCGIQIRQKIASEQPNCVPWRNLFLNKPIVTRIVEFVSNRKFVDNS